jgi:putative lipoic acid-binding regulatory protein
MSDETLLEFPCQFPIKVMGRSNPDFGSVVIEIVSRHVQDLFEQAVTIKPSKDGNYLSVTVIVQANSKQQLDSIYQDLSGHPQVLMTL